MRWPRQIANRVGMILARGRAAARLEAEMQFHLHREIAENLSAGMDPEDARAAALRHFGNPALVRDQARANWSWASLETLLHDLRYGIRTLRRSPGFAAIAVLVMGLGIGANVALFTVVRSVLLKPLPYRDPGRLALVYEDESENPRPHRWLPVDAGSFWEWQEAVKPAAELAMVSPFQNYNVSAQGGKLPEEVDAAWCTSNFFSLLGVHPILGRASVWRWARKDSKC